MAFVNPVVTPSFTHGATLSLSSRRSVVHSRRSVAVRMTYQAGVFEQSNPYADELKATAKYISARGRGILASDESNSTTGKRLASVGVENTEDNRRRWRELLYTAPDLGKYISGAIMFEETLYQSTADGKQFVDVLKDQGIVPGIKVDTGLTALPRTDGETATTGLDGLPERCKKYYEQGARFAKWRAVMRIQGDSCPSDAAIMENAHALARYGQIAQSAGLVPIIEPEVLLDGDHDIEKNAYVSEKVLSYTFRYLNEYDVCLDAILLKPNSITAGTEYPTRDSPETVAKYTLRTMMRGVPAAVPGIHFLSGGLSDEEATNNLNLLNTIEGSERAPWSLTFSYGRALQISVLKLWAGDDTKKEEAQKLLSALAKANSEAQLGKFAGPHPSPGKGERNWQPLRLV
eukprot:CAMPEP_0198323388 /NCGR_PEP_ID=MMETSP1450-20131203/11648_1 /TAXON_ID=753684 ORGANISM="Madagascaria erythrocladiodes, Strain CCMP3234" /NCGR_SAMPLE_ID=MMETSP1450 /ASSEMBLY_ACC=CAM_ASM_001115 /LENGTH=403 /DNA_ID=CAMNT_0044027083 /DNA_START=86 /DNA_END=1297 /DNA_ORIENTATION=-